MIKENHTSYNYLEKYLNKVRSKGRYSFTLPEIRSQFNISDKALNQNLYRLKSKNKISQIRKGFYAIIPPEYSHRGMLPLYLFIDDLMKFLDRRYYVSLYTAAALYGAAHQQPMEYSVIIQNPALRNINNNKININFFVKKDWKDEDIVDKKTDAGYIKVSPPELTALDLLYYCDRIGGINRLFTILQELIDEMKPSKLVKVAKHFTQTPTIQRLGYLLDKEIGNEKLAQPLYKILNERKYYVVPLLPNKKQIKEISNPKWKIYKNVEIESDL